MSMTVAQIAALIELVNCPAGSTLNATHTRTKEVLRLQGWATHRIGGPGFGARIVYHVTPAGYAALAATRDGRAALGEIYDEALTAYVRAQGPVTPHLLRNLIDRYRTMMDSAAHLDDAVHHRTCDELREKAAFVIARIAVAVGQTVTADRLAVLDLAEDLFTQTDPQQHRDGLPDVEPDAETATCIYDGRPIARRTDRPNATWVHIDDHGGRACFADPVRIEEAFPLPGGDRRDTRPSVAFPCVERDVHTPHAYDWPDTTRPAQRYICSGAGRAGDWESPGWAFMRVPQRPVSARDVAEALLVS